jgi:hypothetical protein
VFCAIAFKLIIIRVIKTIFFIVNFGILRFKNTNSIQNSKVIFQPNFIKQKHFFLLL